MSRYIAKTMYLDLPKQPTIWIGGSTKGKVGSNKCLHASSVKEMSVFILGMAIWQTKDVTVHK